MAVPKRNVAVVAWLHKHIGETEHPPGSNRGAFVQSCQAATWLPGSGWPWCVACWVRAWTVAGVKLPYLGAGAYSMLDWYRGHLPGWVVPLRKARPGAAVILNIGAGHLATLIQTYDGGPVIHTIDGNWHDSVSSTTHLASQVRGVVDPPEVATPPPAKPPLFEIVTSASGHKKVVFVGGAKLAGKKLPGLLTRFGGLTIRRKRRA